MKPALGIDIGTSTMAVTGYAREFVELEINGHTPVDVSLTTSPDIGLATGPHATDIRSPLDSITASRPLNVDGQAFTAPTLMEALMTPWMKDMDHMLGCVPKRVATIVPSWWADHYREQYRRALSKLYPEVATVSVAEALSWSMPDDPDQRVCIWDLGHSQASVTLLSPCDRKGRREVTGHVFSPEAGAKTINTVLAQQLGWGSDEESITCADYLRHIVSDAGAAAVDVRATAPDGNTQVFAVQEVTDIIASYMSEVIGVFDEHPDTTRCANRYAIGGMATDKGVVSALREHGPLQVMAGPATLLSHAACMYALETL